LDVLSNKYKTE